MRYSDSVSFCLAGLLPSSGLDFSRSLEIQKRIETKTKAFVGKHTDLVFYLVRLCAYLFVASTWKIKSSAAYGPPTLFDWFEAANYLIILAILILGPTLDDFKNLGE